MKTTTIIVSYNTCDHLRNCLQSVREATDQARKYHIHNEIIVVDNDSRDRSALMVHEEFPEVILLHNQQNLGFAAANNQAYAQSQGDYIFLVNPDSIIDPLSLMKVVSFMNEHADCGICGGKLVGMHGEGKPSARRFPSAWNQFLILSGLSDRFKNSSIFGAVDYKYFRQDQVKEVDWVPGAFTGIRRTLLDELGFFDPRFYLYYEETDLCLRAKRAGWKVYFNPELMIRHEGGACSRQKTNEEFDQSAAQVKRFRMISECLYFYKNYGLLSVLLNIGVEIAICALRFFASYRHREKGSLNRRDYMKTIRQLLAALIETRMGMRIPVTPW